MDFEADQKMEESGGVEGEAGGVTLEGEDIGVGVGDPAEGDLGPGAHGESVGELEGGVGVQLRRFGIGPRVAGDPGQRTGAGGGAQLVEERFYGVEGVQEVEGGNGGERGF